MEKIDLGTRFVMVPTILAVITCRSVSNDEPIQCRLRDGTDVIRIDYPTRDRPELRFRNVWSMFPFEMPGWGDATISRHLSATGEVVAHKGREFALPFELTPWDEVFPWKIRVFYPPMTAGDVVPLGQCVARYEGLVRSVDADQGTRFAAMTFRLLPPDNVPVQARRHANTWAIPMLSPWTPDNGIHFPSGTLHQQRVRVKSITAIPGGPSVARLEIRDSCAQGQFTYSITVQTGDTITLHESGKLRKYRVRAVVSPDENLRLIGWVELDFKPVARDM